MKISLTLTWTKTGEYDGMWSLEILGARKTSRLAFICKSEGKDEYEWCVSCFTFRFSSTGSTPTLKEAKAAIREELKEVGMIE